MRKYNKWDSHSGGNPILFDYIGDMLLNSLDYVNNTAKDITEYPSENNNEIRSNDTMNFNFGNMFNGMFDKVKPGYCKLAMNGEIAVRTAPNVYKTYDVKTGNLVNCSDFAFDMDGMFWVVPTFKVEIGDIILINQKPRRVISIGENSIKAFSYDDCTIDEFVPEHHVFMGKTYCYGKIFCPFKNIDKDDNMMTNMMSMYMMSQMFGNSNSMGNNAFNPMMFMFMGDNNPMMKMFEGAFNFGTNTTNEVKEDK